SGLKRELFRPQPGAVIGWRLAEACAASEIVLLPFLGVRLGARYLEVLVECSPALGPRRIRLLHLRISFHCAKFRLNPFDRAALYREHHAKGFIARKGDRHVLARELPVHREGKWRPIALYDPSQRLNAVFGLVEGTGGQQIIPRFSAE